MPRDANGNYTLPDPDVVAGTTITSTHENDTLADIAAEMEDSLSRSGKGGMLVPFQNDSGDAANPGMTFANDVTAGFFEDGGEVGVSVGGAEVARFDANGITTGSLPPANYEISSSSGAFTTTSITPVDVTNLTVTITTTGRPVLLMLQADSAIGAMPFVTQGASPCNGFISFYRDITAVASFQSPSSVANDVMPVNCSVCFDAPVAGTYTYKVQASVGATGTITVAACKLVACEL